MNFLNPDLTQKLQAINQYLTPRLTHYPDYQTLLYDLNTAIIKQKNQEYFFDKIQSYFEQNKAQYFSQIQEQKRIFLGGQRPDKFKQKINQSYNQINQNIQNTFRKIKQEINQEKIQLTNPFLYDTMMYRVQSAIQDSTVIEYKDKNQVYLSLAIKNKDYNQLLHSYILELCHQELNLWLERQWEILDNDSETGKINELTKVIKQKLEFINPLLSQITISNIENRFSFEISDYVSFSLLEENNKIPFDYHYSQSAWFRLTVVLFVVGMIFIFTNKVFGFIILFIQLLNLLTGRDPKKMRLRQQTKEMKRTMDSKYQFFVRFIADKFLQNFCQYLDEQSTQCQEEVNLIVEQAKEELEQIKLKIDYLKEQIDLLKEDQVEVNKILQD